MISEKGSNITLEQLGSDEVLLRVKKPGTALVRVRWTPYWLAKGGCVERADEWTRVTAREGRVSPPRHQLLTRARGSARQALQLGLR